MSRIFGPAARGNLSLVLSALALLVATSGVAYALANGSVRTKHLADNAVTTAKIRNGAVSTPQIRPGAVTGPKVADGAVDGAAVAEGSLRLSDLGGSLSDQTTTLPSAVPIAANECATLSLRLFNPAPNALLGSMVVGTITSPSGGAVVNNTGVVVPTLLTETSQGGAFIRIGVCAGSSSQTIPAGSIVTWSILEP